MIINLHISLITKRFFRSFDRHSDKTVNPQRIVARHQHQFQFMSSESLMSLASKLYELLQ